MSSYAKSKRFLYRDMKLEDKDEEKKKIYPNDLEKKDILEEEIKREINREFHIMLQKDKFETEDSNKVREFIKEYLKSNKYFFQGSDDYISFVDMIVNDIFGLGVLESYINDTKIDEIWVLGPKKIYIEIAGERIESPLKFKNDKVITSMINKILAPINRKADESTPTVDAHLENGSRVAITMPPIALNGPEIVIRKFKKTKFDLNDYITIGSASKTEAEFLANSVKWGANILVVGGTGTGKTTLLNALSSEIPRDVKKKEYEHVIVIEDARELSIDNPFIQNWEAKVKNAEGKGQINCADLVKHSLRNSPDRIVIGEIRDAVAYYVLQAAITGHRGTMTTIHADNASKAVERFTTLAGSAGVITANEARMLFADAFDIIVVLERVRDIKTNKNIRVITQICHVVGTGDAAAKKLGIAKVDNPSHVYLQDIYNLDKKNMAFKTTGYIPKELMEKASLEHKDYDPRLFEIEKK